MTGGFEGGDRRDGGLGAGVGVVGAGANSIPGLPEGVRIGIVDGKGIVQVHIDGAAIPHERALEVVWPHVSAICEGVSGACAVQMCADGRPVGPVHLPGTKYPDYWREESVPAGYPEV